MIKVEGEVKKVNHKKTRGFADINFNDLVIKGYRIVEGKDGLFVSEPSHADNGEWFKSVYTKNKDLREEIAKVVLEAYAAAPEATQ